MQNYSRSKSIEPQAQTTSKVSSRSNSSKSLFQSSQSQLSLEQKIEYTLSRSNSLLLGTNPLVKKNPGKADNLLYQKYHPDNFARSKYNRISLHKLNPTEIEISSLVVKLEERRKNFTEKFQKLIQPQPQKKDILISLADIKLPRNKGNIPVFMKNTRRCLNQLE